jgi:hypothetical protein
LYLLHQIFPCKCTGSSVRETRNRHRLSEHQKQIPCYKLFYFPCRYTTCGTGYTLNYDNGECEDTDECAFGMDNCAALGPEYLCLNLQGSFREEIHIHSFLWCVATSTIRVLLHYCVCCCDITGDKRRKNASFHVAGPEKDIKTPKFVNQVRKASLQPRRDPERGRGLLRAEMPNWFRGWVGRELHRH